MGRAAAEAAAKAPPRMETPKSWEKHRKKVRKKAQFQHTFQNDLAASARSEYVFQRAIQDLELIDGRKFVVRFFFWVYQGSLYLHQHGVLVVHGARYDANSAEAAVQFQHDWYDNDSETYLMTLQSSDQDHLSSDWRWKYQTPKVDGILSRSSTKIFEVFETLIHKTAVGPNPRC
eukprot:s5429_g1.t1